MDARLREVMAMCGYEGGGEGALPEAVDGFARFVEARVRREAVLSAGVPEEMAERYERLAQTYMQEGGGFGEALSQAVTDFPVWRQAGVPGDAGAGRVVASARGTEREMDWRRMTLMERAQVFRDDPELARRLAKAAGEVL